MSCFTGKIEMGQGVITSLAQMLAEELNISLDSVDMVMGDRDLCPWDMGTFGSMTTRFSWLPKIETVLVEADDFPPQGGGEPAIINMGGVVANAIFDATGARLFQLPMTPERIRAAISRAKKI